MDTIFVLTMNDIISSIAIGIIVLFFIVFGIFKLINSVSKNILKNIWK